MSLPLLWRTPAPLVGDSLGYWTLAQNLLKHAVFSASMTAPFSMETLRTPGYPLFLAPFAVFFQHPQLPVAIAQSIIGTLTVVWLWRWLYDWTGPKGAALGASILSFDPIILLHTPLVMSETLYTLLLSEALIYTLDKRAARAGALWSATAFVRPISLFLPVFFCPLWRNKRKAIVLFLVCAYSLPLLWILRNGGETGHYVFSSVGGISLLRYPAAGVESLDTRRSMAELDLDLRTEVDREHPNGYSSDAAQSAAYGSAAFAILKRHPILLARYCSFGALKVLGGVGVEMAIDWSGGKPETNLGFRPGVSGEGTIALLRRHPEFIPFALGYGAVLGCLYVLSIRGLFLLSRGGKNVEALILSGTTAFLLAMASSQGYYRYRIPLMPPLAIAAAAAMP